MDELLTWDASQLKYTALMSTQMTSKKVKYKESHVTRLCSVRHQYVINQGTHAMLNGTLSCISSTLRSDIFYGDEGDLLNN